MIRVLVRHMPDPMAAGALYRALGFDVAEEQHGQGPRHVAVGLPAGQVMELYPGEGTAEGLDLWLEVADLSAARQALQGRTGAEDRGDAVIFRDADGARIRLVARAPLPQPPAEVRGSCLCGAVRYRVTGPLRPVVGCHCVQCRKTSGHHVAATSARREDIAIDGEVRWFGSSDSARRGFCPTCGSSLFWDPSDGARLSIHAGTLDAPTGLALAGHIFTADKGDYYAIADDLPQAPGAHPALTTQG